jgi:hypothetical protein
MRILLFILSWFCASVAFAGPLKTQEETGALCSAVANKLGAGQTDAAFELLAPNWPLAPEELKQLAYQTKSQLEMVSARFGAPIGAEFVKSTLAGKSFVQHLYVVKFERHALRLACTFYKPKDAWLVNGITWDDSTAKLFE